MPGYISEYSYFGFADTEFIEIAVPTGTDISGYSIMLYQADGTVVESYPFGMIQGTMAGQDIYVIDNNTPGFSSMDGSGEIWIDDAIALVDGSGNVLQFISHGGNTVTATSGPANGMTSTNAGSTANMGDSLQSDDGGSAYYSQTSPNSGTIPACYAPGTLIDTPMGARLVENLRPGDSVTTAGDDTAVIRWVWRGRQALDDVSDDKYPVLIRAGVLGTGLPRRDLIVSAQHRMLVGEAGQLTRAFDTGVLVPAKALTGLRGIRYMKGRNSAQWIHFACGRHHVVRAEGCWSESLLLGRVIVRSMPAYQQRFLTRLFPADEGAEWLNGPPARQCLSVGETRKVLEVQKVLC